MLEEDREDPEFINEKTNTTSSIKRFFSKFKKKKGNISFTKLGEDTDDIEKRSTLGIWPEYTSNILSRFTFSWLNPLVDLAQVKAINREKSVKEGENTKFTKKDTMLTIDDMFETALKDDPSEKYKEFLANWEIEKKKPKPSLLRAFHTTYFYRFWLSAIFMFWALDIQIFFGPMLLSKMLQFVGEPDADPKWGYIYAVGFFINSVTNSMIMNQFWHTALRIGWNVKSAVTVALYRKVMKINTRSRQDIGVGKILNLMSSDTEKIMECSWQVHATWASALQLLFTIALLFRYVGWSCLAGIGTVFILSPVTAFITRKISKFRIAANVMTDSRVKAMHEILKGIKVIKFYAYENEMVKKIRTIRHKELGYVRKIAYLKEINASLAVSGPVLMSISTFVIYSLFNEMRAEVAFTVLSLFASSRVAIRLLPQAINNVVEARVAIKRIQDFLLLDDIEEDNQQKDTESDASIIIENGKFAWRENSDIGALNNINLRIKKDELFAIVGPVGSGKSTLISSLLGETFKLNGKMLINSDRVAYLAQQPWIFHGTLRDNILFGLEYDEKKYLEVLEYSALRADLEQLPDGDKTEIGDRGVNLSGGQKQRVSMARALYRKDITDIFLMDDPLSAVDQHVQRQLFSSIVNVLRGKTRVLITHQLSLLNQVDRVMVLDNGNVTAIGTFEELASQGVDFSAVVMSSKDKPTDEETEKDKKTAPKEKELPKKGAKLVEEEEQRSGSISFGTYKFYIKSMGGIFYFIFLLTIFTSTQLSRVLSDWWLSEWSQNTGGYSIGFNIGIYCALSVGFILLSLVRAVSIVNGSIQASVGLHESLLNSILHAPLLFFQSNPVGRILNRFSRDIQATDEQLPSVIHSFVDALFTIVSVLCIVSINSPFLLFMFPPIMILYFRMQKRFRRISREVKRLDSITKSPIFQHFEETINGLETIRAFHMQHKFENENILKFTTNLRVSMTSYTLNRWLSIRLESIGGIIVFVTALVAVYRKDVLGPGLVGFSLTYALMLTGILNGLVRAFADFEIKLNSIERLCYYIDIKPEEDIKEVTLIQDDLQLERVWPSKGAIDFANLEARYKFDQDPVLRNVALSIRPGEKVGVVGRTGAGKSSLVLALFRLVDITNGTIMIDNEDIKQVELQKLRSNISIVPQDPVLFNGTVRSNLDIIGKFEDKDIWQALQQAQLKATIEALPGKLEYPVVDGGENFSLGQRQLFCLARALLQKNKIIVLDEATSATDMECDRAIQEVIRTEFSACTMIVIAHRINTVVDSDKILVMDKGQVGEFENPKVLLSNPSSLFYSLYHAHVDTTS